MGSDKAFYTMKFTYFSPTGVGRCNFDMVNTRIHSVQSKKKHFFQLPGNFSRLYLDFLVTEVESKKIILGWAWSTVQGAIAHEICCLAAQS